MRLRQNEILAATAVAMYIVFFATSPPDWIQSVLAHPVGMAAVFGGALYTTLYWSKLVGGLLILAFVLSMTRVTEHLTINDYTGTFNETTYLAANPDVANAIKAGTFKGTALDHWTKNGINEGRKGSGMTLKPPPATTAPVAATTAPVAATTIPPNGTIVNCAGGGGVGIMENGMYRVFASPTVAASYDPNWSRVAARDCTNLPRGTGILVPRTTVPATPPAAAAVSIPADGTVVACTGGPVKGIMEGGKLRAFANPTVADSYSSTWRNARGVDCTKIPQGAPITSPKTSVAGSLAATAAATMTPSTAAPVLAATTTTAPAVPLPGPSPVPQPSTTAPPPTPPSTVPETTEATAPPRAVMSCNVENFASF